MRPEKVRVGSLGAIERPVEKLIKPMASVGKKLVTPNVKFQLADQSDLLEGGEGKP